MKDTQLKQLWVYFALALGAALLCHWSLWSLPPDAGALTVSPGQVAVALWSAVIAAGLFALAVAAWCWTAGRLLVAACGLCWAIVRDGWVLNTPTPQRGSTAKGARGGRN